MSAIPSIYLAGPISGLSYDDARYGWRKDFQDLLFNEFQADHVDLYSPMRGKDALSKIKNIEGDRSYEQFAVASQAGIVGRDRFDVRNCALMVANFLDVEKVSIGTCIEFGWADAFGTPTIMVIEPEGNSHEHVMLRGLATYRVSTLREAAALASLLLTPGL